MLWFMERQSFHNFHLFHFNEIAVRLYVSDNMMNKNLIKTAMLNIIDR